MDVDSLPNGGPAADGAASATAQAPTLTAAAIPSSKLTRLTESLKLEHQFLRVPFEDYKKTIRINQRSIEKELSNVVSSASYSAESKDDAVNHLTSLVSRLQGLKRKLDEGNRVENAQLQRCKVRLEHLESVDMDNMSEWNSIRLKRIIVDYMLRMSYYETGMQLAETSNILDLVDIGVFQEARKIIDALQNRDVSPALAWCNENKPKLKKAKSKFEFQLRLQEFLEMVRAEKYMPAILYSQKHLATWSATYTNEFLRVFATLAFKSTTECSVYKNRFEPKQWEYLVENFKHEFCRLYGMTIEPLLHIFLQAGLSALKTPYCYEDDCSKEDPLSNESFRKLASPLPYSKQHNSKLVCYITKELMDTENPPQVLPNGYVYSTKALEEMARKHNGKITCPRTGFACNYSEVVKAFIS